jgi:hypothetical protein
MNLTIENPDAPVNERKWTIEVDGGVLILSAWSDDGARNESITVIRTGAKIDRIEDENGRPLWCGDE